MSKGHLSSPRAARRLERLEQELQDRYDSDLASVMETPEGRRTINRIIFDTCRLKTSSFVPDNVGLTAFNEGKRAVGAFLEDEIWRVAPLNSVHMEQESRILKQEENLHRDDAVRTPEDDE